MKMIKMDTKVVPDSKQVLLRKRITKVMQIANSIKAVWISNLVPKIKVPINQEIRFHIVKDLMIKIETLMIKETLEIQICSIIENNNNNNNNMVNHNLKTNLNSKKCILSILEREVWFLQQTINITKEKIINKELVIRNIIILLIIGQI